MTDEAVYVLEKMAHGFNRMGRAAGRGFYDYDDDEASPQLWSGLKVFERRRVTIPAEDVRDRLVHMLALTAAACLERGTVARADDADLAAVLGAGYPAQEGSALGLIAQTRSEAFTARARELAAKYGPRFMPDALRANGSTEHR